MNLLKVVYAKNQKPKTTRTNLMKIRNPWNKKGNKNYETEWQGDWGDKDS